MPAFFDTGFFVRTPAWHRLGTVLTTPPTAWSDAWSVATGGKPWDIVTEPVMDARGKELASWRAIRRNDSEDIMHVASASYAPIGMGEYGALIDEVRSHYGDELEYETTVVLHKGRRIATTLTIPSRTWSVHGDPSAILPYLNFMTSHDESVSWRAGVSNVRIVCANTLAAAVHDMRERHSGLVLRHTSNWRQRIPEIIKGLDEQIKGIDAIQSMAASMAVMRLSRRQVEEYMEKLIPYSTAMTPRQMNNVMNKRAQLLELLDSETNQAIAGTRWGVYQAALEMVDHVSTARSLDSRVDRTLFGSVDGYKSHAMRLAMMV